MQKGYAKNKEGFRSDPFNPRKDINVASIGCSNVLGWALEEKDTFPYIFCSQLSQKGKSVNNWNLGLGGKSNDYIARAVWACELSIKPDVYLIVFTGMGRREYWDVLGNCIDYVPSNCAQNFKWLRETRPEEFPIHQTLHQLTSPNDNLVNFVKNFQTINQLLRGTPWYYTFANPDEQGGSVSVNKLIDQSRYIGYIKPIDKAEDGLHPGPGTNRIIAESFLKSYLNELVSESNVEGTDKVVRNLQTFTFLNN